MNLELNYTPGDSVKVINGDIVALINSINIDRSLVPSYNCEWFIDGVKYCYDFYDCEISPFSNNNSFKIGFNGSD